MFQGIKPCSLFTLFYMYPPCDVLYSDFVFLQKKKKIQNGTSGEFVHNYELEKCGFNDLFLSLNQMSFVKYNIYTLSSSKYHRMNVELCFRDGFGVFTRAKTHYIQITLVVLFQQPTTSLIISKANSYPFYLPFSTIKWPFVFCFSSFLPILYDFGGIYI